MPEMPIPQDYNRFVEPVENDQNLEDNDSVFEMFDEDSGVEELPDGSAIVKLDDMKGPEENPDFYENLAEKIDNWELDKIALKYLDLIEKDKQAREERDKQYEEGLRRTGLGHDAPGGAQFMGASKVVHPVMAEACVDFAARAIKDPIRHGSFLWFVAVSSFTHGVVMLFSVPFAPSPLHVLASMPPA